MANMFRLTEKTKQNFAAMATIPVLLAPFVAYMATREVPEIDPELSTLAEATFPDIHEAIENAGTQFVKYDAADRLGDIHALMLDGEAESAQYRRAMSMGEAAALFEEVAQDGVFMKSYQCDLDEESGSYDCDVRMAELGGVVADGAASEQGLNACEVISYDVTVTSDENGLSLSVLEGDTNLYQHRIAEKYALAARVNLNDFTEEAPHKGPQGLEDIAANQNVHFHPNTFRTGEGFWSRDLGDDQIAGERVFAALSDCIITKE